MRNRKNVIIAVMVCAVLLMAIGYSYFATRLNINATGNITTNWNVYFSNITDGTIVGSASNNKTPSVTATTATMDANLALPGDSITYEITLTNGGTIGAIIEDIKAEASGSTAINYSISGIKIGDKLAGNESKTITVKIEYDPNTTSQPSKTNKTLTITIDAVQDIGQSITESDVVIDDTTVCTLASDSTVAKGEYGAKYDCKVDPNKDPYTFYLIDNNDDGTSDLIMNANINASGESVIPEVTEDTGEVAWNTSENNTDGPVTAMTYLYNATKNWTNVEPVNYEYYDRQVQGIDLDNPVNEGGNRIGYQSFISTNGIGVITKGDVDSTQVTIGTESEPLRARMPIYSNNSTYSYLNEVGDKTETSSFLYENLYQDLDNEDSSSGYWLLSSNSELVDFAWYVGSMGYAEYVNESGTNMMGYAHYGVRPVITVKL